MRHQLLPRQKVRTLDQQEKKKKGSGQWHFGLGGGGKGNDRLVRREEDESISRNTILEKTLKTRNKERGGE